MLQALPAEGLPELARVYWRPRADESRISRRGTLWTLTTVAHTVPFISAAVLLAVLKPVTLPVGLVLLAHAWVIPELYAARGAGVLRSGPGGNRAAPERVALGLLGDLLDHRARELHHRSGLVLEQGALGWWLIGQRGAVLVRPGGHRVFCYCVAVTDAELPPSDRVAHLLLALREDEEGFATVANLTFSGARWRLGRRILPAQRNALELAARLAAGHSAS